MIHSCLYIWWFPLAQYTIFNSCLDGIHPVTEIEVADVRKSLTQAIIVHLKIVRENVAVDIRNININQKNPKNMYGIIIQTPLITVLIQTTVVYHEL